MREAAATTSIASSMMRVAPRSVGLQNGVRWNPIFMGPLIYLSPRLAAAPLSSNCGPLPRDGGEGFKKPLAPDGGEGFEKFFLCGRGMRRSFRQGGEEAVNA